METFFKKNADAFNLVFRVIVGVVFFLHGWMKFGGLSAGTTPLMSLMALAFLIECVGGLLLVLGLFTRSVALIAALEMAYAFFAVHVMSGGINPLANKGEPALLFFAAFLMLLAYGAGRYSVDSKLSRK